jgi:carbamoyltransferase
MGEKTYYIGLGVTYHDPSLAIVDETGATLFAEAGERYLQYKRAINCEPDPLYRLPGLLDEFCPDAGRFVLAFSWRSKRPWYEQAASALGLLNAKGLNRKGFKRLATPLDNRQIHHMMACNRQSLARGGLNLAQFLGGHYSSCKVEFRDFDHHDCHAASACYASPFREASCAVVDSYGENGSLCFYRFGKGNLERVHESRGLGSLGLYYMHITALCGFDWMQGEEWKVMGLAPYGRLDEEVYLLLEKILTVNGLNLEHPQGQLFPALAKLEKKRRAKSSPAARAADLAYTGQYYFARIMTELLSNFHAAYPSDHLALAGGCALNSSYNGQITHATNFCKLYVPPAPADDGAALGAAWLAFAREQETFPSAQEPLSAYLGSTLSDAALARLVRFSAGLEVLHLPESISEEAARLLAQGKLVAWVQGRAEFGPRALGNRSILADPRDPGMKAKINERVKFREEYRPFAPSILHEYGPEYFADYTETPYMEQALRFRPEAAARVPAVVHVDGTGRLQTVKQSWNPRFHRLLMAFHRETGVPLLLNTSFNVMGKPMVHAVEDAVAVFMTSGLDALVIGDWLFVKPDAP